MLPEYFAVVGAIIASLGGIYYLYETILSRTKPNRITWLLWGVFPMITFTAQRVQGVQSLSWATFAAGLPPLLVFAASLSNKKAYWHTKPVDYLCLALGIIGILLWAITNDPNLAIMFSILADLAAGTPTIIKSWTHPETESWKAYAISTVGFVIAIISIHRWIFQNYAFLLYLLIVNGIITILASRGVSKSIVLEQ